MALMFEGRAVVDFDAADRDAAIRLCKQRLRALHRQTRRDAAWHQATFYHQLMLDTFWTIDALAERWLCGLPEWDDHCIANSRWDGPK
jgi:hypothetical protein